ncbi:unnamed protein product, partial [Closterium sp. NIES-53]
IDDVHVVPLPPLSPPPPHPIPDAYPYVYAHVSRRPACPACPTCAAAASALAAAATVLAAAAPALSAVLRAPRALQPCTPRAPCCLVHPVRPVRPAALCTRICIPMRSPYPTPPPPLSPPSPCCTSHPSYGSLAYELILTLNPRQIRWLDFLESNFHYTVTYKKGASNIADALTRPTAQVHAILLAQTSPLLTGLFTHGYKTDPFFTGGNSQQFAAVRGVYHVKAGTDRIWVPGYTLLRELLLQEAHDGVTSGHFGVEKTRQQLQRYYYWPEMLTDVQRHVASCPTCQLMKSSWKRPAGQLQPIPPPERAWQQVTMDFVTGLPAGASGNDSILVVVDRLTKMAHFNHSRRNDPPLHLNHRSITRDTSSDHQRSRYEIHQQFLAEPVAAVRHEAAVQLFQLPLIEFAYNNSPSATTQQSPFYRNYGKDPTVPMTPNPDNPVPRAQQFAEVLQAARTRAADAIKKANVIAKRNADRHRRPVTYQPDDLVLLDTQNLRLPITPKLRPRYCGPFRISHMIIPVTAHLLLLADWVLYRGRRGFPACHLRGPRGANLTGSPSLPICAPSLAHGDLPTTGGIPMSQQRLQCHLNPLHPLLLLLLLHILLLLLLLHLPLLQIRLISVPVLTNACAPAVFTSHF